MARRKPIKKATSKGKLQNSKTKKPKDFKRISKKPREFALMKGKPVYEIGEFIGHEKFDRFRKNYLSYQKKNNSDGITFNCHLFGLGNVLKLLNQPGCHGMRVYYGMEKRKEKFVPQIMLVGVYQDGNNMLDHTLILDASLPCPEYCDDSELL